MISSDIIYMQAIDYLRRLVAVTPHRGSASPQERIAANWIAGELLGMGYHVTEQPFRTTRDNLYLVPVQVFAIAIAAGWLSLVGHPLPSGLLLACGLAILLAEVSGYPLDLSLLPRFPSRNVYTESPTNASPTIFVTAHYDTQRGSFLFHPRLLPYLQPFFYLCYAGLVGLYLGVATEAAGWRAALILVRASLAMCTAALGTFLLAEFTGRYTPGANDNGSGTALALYLAERYARERHENPSRQED